MNTSYEVEVVFIIGTGKDSTTPSIKLNEFPPYQLGEKIIIESGDEKEPRSFLIDKIVNVLRTDEKNIKMIKRIYHLKTQSIE